jgi:competence protein ComEC
VPPAKRLTLILAVLASFAAHAAYRARSSSADAATAVAPPPASNAPAPQADRHLTVHFYDVGQGLAALVDLPDGRHILVDAGDSPRRPECGDSCAAKNRRLLAQLRADLHGAPIDLLWITHQHSDHIGGAPEVLRAFAVLAYVDNGRELAKGEVERAHRAAEERGAVVHAIDPEHLAPPLASSAEVVLTPIVPPAWPVSCSRDPNDCSIGLRIDFRSSSILFVGDAEHEEEGAIDPRGAVTLLQVAHHGSETSSSPRFLARAAPKYAVISAGAPGEALNRDYCHPRASIVERLTRVLGGATSRSLLGFDGERCDRARPSDWISVPASDHLWATERDGDVVLTTTGDGAFERLPR